MAATNWQASTVSVPHFEAKHLGRPFVTPHQVLSYRAGLGRVVETPPSAVVLGWQSVLLERVRAERPIREISGPAGAVLELSPALGFAFLPVGAPVAAIVIEELAALGVKNHRWSRHGRGAFARPSGRSGRGVLCRAEG